jgi:anaerobic ribonucleoside-triphosphate reductase
MSPIQIKRTECIIYSRVVGWLTPTKNYNKGKTAEWRDRVPYRIDQDKINES